MRSLEIVTKSFTRLMSAAILSLGAAWLYTFLFTDFRTHHAVVMIPIGILIILFSVGLFRMARWCIAGSFLVSIGVLSFSAWIQLSVGEVHIFFMACSLVSLVGIAAFAFLLYGSRGAPWTHRLVE